MLICELTVSDAKRLQAYSRICDSLLSITDTGMLKFCLGKLHILCTEPESTCAIEIEFDEPTSMVFGEESYTVKILFDSFANEVRKVLKNKHTLHLLVTDDKPFELKSQEEAGSTKRIIDTFVVGSAEHRARIFRHISAEVLRKKSINVVELALPCAEMNRLINTFCIAAGSIVMQTTCNCTFHDDKNLVVTFETQSQNGFKAYCRICCPVSATTKEPNRNVLLNYKNTKPFTMKYTLAYLKRFQSLIFNSTDYINLYLSENGMLLRLGEHEDFVIKCFISANQADSTDSYA